MKHGEQGEGQQQEWWYAFIYILTGSIPTWRVHQGLLLTSVVGLMVNVLLLLGASALLTPHPQLHYLIPWTLFISCVFSTLQIALSFCFLVAYIPMNTRAQPHGRLGFDGTIRLPQTISAAVGLRPGDFVYFVEQHGCMTLVTGDQFDELMAAVEDQVEDQT